LIINVDETGNWIVADRWPSLHQKFLISLQEIEEVVKFVQQLQDAERSSWVGRVAKAQSEVVEQLPDVDLSEAAFPCHEIPALDKSFLGRSDELDSIDKALGKRSLASLRMVIISGLGGVGKSALALTAAHRCKTAKGYDAIFWLNAENVDVLRESFTRIALRLLLRGASDKSDKDRNFMLVKN
jgi:AAA ATPase domain